MSHALRLLVVILVAAGVVAGAAPAGALEVVVGGHAGYGSYTQDDLNAAIREFNAGSGTQDEIKAGPEYGGRLGLRLNASAVLGVGYSRLVASSAGTAAGRSSEVSVPADCWVVALSWLPDNDNVWRVGLGAEGGVVTAQGHAEIVEPGGAVTRTRYDGDGLFLSGYVVGDVLLSGRWGLYLHGGFRLANVSGVDIDGEATTYDLDYSGAFIRAGVQLAIGGEPR